MQMLFLLLLYVHFLHLVRRIWISADDSLKYFFWFICMCVRVCGRVFCSKNKLDTQFKKHHSFWVILVKCHISWNKWKGTLEWTHLNYRHFFTRETTFVTSCLLSWTLAPFWKGVYSKRKEFAPGDKFFPLRVNHLQKGVGTISTKLSPLKVSVKKANNKL